MKNALEMGFNDSSIGRCIGELAALPGRQRKWNIGLHLCPGPIYGFRQMPTSLTARTTRRFMNQPRSLEEIKNDIRARLGHRAPFLHADKVEAEEALGKMSSMQGETWAQAWNELGARWET